MNYYIKSTGEHTISCDVDLVITKDKDVVLISLVDYAIKNKKICADFIKSNCGTKLTLENRDDVSFKKELNKSWNTSYNYKSDRVNEYTHTIIRTKNINDYVIDWEDKGKIKIITDYLRNKKYMPVTEIMIEKVLNSKKYMFTELEVYTNNPMFKDLKAYYVNIYAIENELNNIKTDLIDSFNWDEIESIEDYIFKFLDSIKNKISETVKPLYNPKKIYSGIYEGVRPFDGQVPLIQGALEVLGKEKFIYVGAEQGVGKTIIGSKINHNYFKYRGKSCYITLIVAPAITLTQWKEEIKRSFNEKANIIIVKKTNDFIKCIKGKVDKPTYILIGKETFKLSYSKIPSYKKATRTLKMEVIDDYYKQRYSRIDSWMKKTEKKKVDVLLCPKCGLPLKNTNRTIEDIYFEEKDFKTINKGNYKCHNCGEILWSAAYNKTKKTSIIDYIHRKGITFDSVIIDEAHESNNSSSIIGNATRTLMRNHAKRVIALSGTSNNGYASSLHNLLMALFPKKLTEDDCIDVKDFIKKYGTLQAITEIKDERKRYFSNGKSEIKDSEYKEIEGINPIVFTKYLASNCLFATLDDLGKDLPELKEQYIAIEATNSQISGERSLFDDIKKANNFNAKMYVDSIIKHYINNPFEWNTVPVNYGEDIRYAQPMNLPDKTLPKEEKLVELVKQENSQGRKVWIYTDFNNGGEYMKGEKLPNRLERILSDQGLKVFQLKPTVTTYERKEVIDKNKDKYDVFISNAKLVNVGLNLVFCPTYIFYMPSYLVNVVSQASRRGYRANSTIENRIYHLYYSNTWENDIIKRYQRKLAESKAINGQFDVMLEDSKDIRTASQLSNKISNTVI